MFSEIVKVPFLPQGGPASVNAITRKLTLSEEYWSTMKHEWKIFILLHELAHLNLNSSDELEVDAYAMKWYVKLGYSPKEAVYALTKVLNLRTTEQIQRIVQQLDLAKHYDYLYNNNKKAKSHGTIRPYDRHIFS